MSKKELVTIVAPFVAVASGYAVNAVVTKVVNKRAEKAATRTAAPLESVKSEKKSS